MKISKFSFPPLIKFTNKTREYGKSNNFKDSSNNSRRHRRNRRHRLAFDGFDDGRRDDGRNDERDELLRRNVRRNDDRQFAAAGGYRGGDCVCFTPQEILIRRKRL
jgi:hypothetical protein